MYSHYLYLLYIYIFNMLKVLYIKMYLQCYNDVVYAVLHAYLRIDFVYYLTKNVISYL